MAWLIALPEEFKMEIKGRPPTITQRSPEGVQSVTKVNPLRDNEIEIALAAV